MSKDKLKNQKKEIANRYKGRGNCWVRVEKESSVGEKINSFLLSLTDADDYIKNCNREGFFWMRYSKVEEKNSTLFTTFEVRVKGSKIDHPEHRITFEDQEVASLDLLGGTPFKLQLETENKVIRTNNSSKEKSIVKKDKNDLIKDEAITKNNYNEEITKVLEKELTAPSKQELKDWIEFLSATGLLKKDT